MGLLGAAIKNIRKSGRIMGDKAYSGQQKALAESKNPGIVNFYRRDILNTFGLEKKKKTTPMNNAQRHNGNLLGSAQDLGPKKRDEAGTGSLY